MTQNRTFHNRKYPRASWHDYSGGTYFVTVCTKEQRCTLGSVQNRRMIRSCIGEFLDFNLLNIGIHQPDVQIPVHTVMPNHFHALIIIDGCLPNNTLSQFAYSSDSQRKFIGKGDVRDSLGVVVGGIKSAVTRFARKQGLDFGWQPRYYDHIVRTWSEYDNISNYILTNVETWESDCFHVLPH